MDNTIEDALVEWFEAEQARRIQVAQERNCNVVDLARARSVPNRTSDRLFEAVDGFLTSLSVLQPTTDWHQRVYTAHELQVGNA